MPITEKERDRLVEILGKLNTTPELIRLSGLIYNTLIQAKMPSDALIFLGKQVYAGVPWETIPNKWRILLFRAVEEFTIKYLPQIYDLLPPENAPPAPVVESAQEVAPDGLPDLPPEFQMEAAQQGGSAGDTRISAPSPSPLTNPNPAPSVAPSSASPSPAEAESPRGAAARSPGPGPAQSGNRHKQQQRQNRPEPVITGDRQQATGDRSRTTESSTGNGPDPGGEPENEEAPETEFIMQGNEMVEVPNGEGKRKRAAGGDGESVVKASED